MFKAFVVAIVATAVCVVSMAALAAETNRDEIQGIKRIDRNSARQHDKRLTREFGGVPCSTADEPWVGNRTDAAGNSYVYFRAGVGTPFSPGSVLR